MEQLELLEKGFEKHVSLAVEELAAGKAGAISGIAFKYGKLKDRPMDIKAGAFEVSCGKTVPLVVGHDEAGVRVIGSAKLICSKTQINFAGNLNLDRDELTQQFLNPEAATIHSSLKRNDLDSVSIGFDILEYTFQNDGTLDVINGAINELSIVVTPAVPAAKVKKVLSQQPTNAVEVDDISYEGAMSSIVKQLKSLGGN